MHALLVSSLLLFAWTCLARSNGALQKVAVKGRLLCGTAPAINVTLKLVDEDIGFDDKLNQGTTNPHGEFYLEGESNEKRSIDPLLKIYHECIDHFICEREWKLGIPKDYIAWNNRNLKVFNIGTFNLELKPRSEKRDCA
ncbi:unnamed protein product [Soboliphyme baturini]|uniref:Transthyretin-like family protein n=1 Tax=Soboliphyme baturini TaxID=241478 RepID=A0A183IFW2_9BILA|nr:unnamed protein product [Soboliphyme baturini]